MSYATSQHLGKTIALFAGLVHLIWIVLVWTGAAQWCLEFGYRMHGVSVPVTFEPLSIASAILLLVLAIVKGYILGWVIGFIWDKTK